MRKSPFSTPRGNGGQQGFKWKSNERRGCRGYVPYMNNSFDSNYSPDTSLNSSTSDDFIAFDTSSPSHHDKMQNESYGSRGGRNRNFQRSPGFRVDHYSPRPHFNNSSPYRNNHRQSWSKNNRIFHHGTPKREVHISQYLDLISFLEDPWKDLWNENVESSIAEDNLHDVSINSNTGKIDPDNSIDSRISVDINDYKVDQYDSSINEEKESIDELVLKPNEISADN